ncbi:hypothetical protein [Sphingomicrobium lutaoense]|uniref:Uncharacterized protein n=1 Tax=Sphingomicrobium lutaoense TaxID=515949 RepID=A0A839YZC8_9SPHN|nr:hypothetical protein [Sphingomicrobium lutaoense]MBB3764346.1 hypothetical protein [Sphingomicrobium lutaoense]
MIRPFSARRPIIMGAIFGSYLGLFLWGMLLVARDMVPSGPAWALPLMILVYGAFIVPVAALGLLLFGLPAARAVGGDFRAPWLPLAAVVMGAIAGNLLVAGVLILTTGRWGTPGGIDPLGPGTLIGAATGLAFWWFERQWRADDADRRQREGEWSGDFDPDDL